MLGGRDGGRCGFCVFVRWKRRVEAGEDFEVAVARLGEGLWRGGSVSLGMSFWWAWERQHEEEGRGDAMMGS